MSEPIRIELVGGPKDGTTVVIPSFIKLYDVAIPETLSVEDDSSAYPPKSSIGRYRVNPMFRRTSSGALVYDWQGLL